MKEELKELDAMYRYYMKKITEHYLKERYTGWDKTLESFIQRQDDIVKKTNELKDR